MLASQACWCIEHKDIGSRFEQQGGTSQRGILGSIRLSLGDVDGTEPDERAVARPGP